ncbi:MAG: hypothetical protein ABR972_09690 [Acidimicrobiales bacterium]
MSSNNFPAPQQLLRLGYEKLGISGRHELAEALRDRPPDSRRRS